MCRARGRIVTIVGLDSSQGRFSSARRLLHGSIADGKEMKEMGGGEIESKLLTVCFGRDHRTWDVDLRDGGLDLYSL